MSIWVDSSTWDLIHYNTDNIMNSLSVYMNSSLLLSLIHIIVYIMMMILVLGMVTINWLINSAGWTPTDLMIGTAVFIIVYTCFYRVIHFLLGTLLWALFFVLVWWWMNLIWRSAKLMTVVGIVVLICGASYFMMMM